jgi:glucokinase
LPLYLGIDIGGTKIAAALVQDDGVVCRHETIRTPARDGASAILHAVVHLARNLIDPCEEPIAAVGVGSGGQIDASTGTVLSASGLLPGWTGMKLGKTLTEALKLPVFVDNDVNALAAGEARFGVARGERIVLFIALGTGVGGALLIDGQLHHGAHWSGAEFGHILLSIDPKARRDAGGAVGTLEAYASGHGLTTTYQELTPKSKTQLSGEEIATEALSMPEGPAAAAVALTGEYLGYGLVTLANALDPSLIVVGGGMAALGERLLGPARRILKERALPGPAKTKIVTASLGAQAAAIGAASLAMSPTTLPVSKPSKGPKTV